MYMSITSLHLDVLDPINNLLYYSKDSDLNCSSKIQKCFFGMRVLNNKLKSQAIRVGGRNWMRHR